MPQHKALLLQSKQGAFEVVTVETPKPGPGDVLVKILATALNPVNWKIQKYDIFVENYPAVLGSDSAGVVEQVGEGVTGFKQASTKVTLRTIRPHFRGILIVPAEILAKIPEHVSYDQAASVPAGLGAAAVGFYHPPEKAGAGLTPPWEHNGEGKYKGQGTLIFGGSSSVGQYAIQFARLSGFSTIVTTASLHNTELLKSLGATHVIDRKSDVVSEARKIFTNRPDTVYDAVSEESTQEQAWKTLAPNGHLILVLPPVASLKDGEDGKTRANVYGNVHVQRELGKSLYSKLTGLLQSGKIKPNRVEVVPGGLAGIVLGLKRMEENKVSGLKLVVRPHETA